MNSHDYRIGDISHSVVNIRKRISRKNRHHAICGVRIPRDAQRITMQAVINCDICVSGIAALDDILDTNYNYPNHDDGTGRFV